MEGTHHEDSVSCPKDSLLIGRVVLCHQVGTLILEGVGNCRDRETSTFTVALESTPEGPGVHSLWP